MLRLLVPFLIVFLAVVSGGSASEKNEDSHTKNEKEEQYYHITEKVVVTATMTKKTLKDCSTSVEVLEADDLNVLSASNALNILNYSPGIFVRKSGDFGRADGCQHSGFLDHPDHLWCCRCWSVGYPGVGQSCGCGLTFSGYSLHNLHLPDPGRGISRCSYSSSANCYWHYWGTNQACDQA